MRYFLVLFSLGVAVGAALAPLTSAAAQADEQVVCHYTYGGEKKALRVAPTDAPYGVAPVPVGSYFLFRVVFARPPAAPPVINIYVYADQEGGPVPVQQASYPYPPHAWGDYGFTGWQRVYEPLRDGELEYWCALDSAGSAA